MIAHNCNIASTDNVEISHVCSRKNIPTLADKFYEYTTLRGFVGNIKRFRIKYEALKYCHVDRASLLNCKCIGFEQRFNKN